MERLGRQLYLTFRMMRDRLDDDMRAVGGSMSQWIVLKTVGDHPELSQRELADRVLLTGSTLTHHLDRMETAGYISRSRDTSDRRVVRVSLTEAGKHRRVELDSVVEEHEERIASLLPANEAKTLTRHLGRLQERLGEHEGARR
jgi:DNA-binding MarR family transcriptional regulator